MFTQSKVTTMGDRAKSHRPQVSLAARLPIQAALLAASGPVLWKHTEVPGGVWPGNCLWAGAPRALLPHSASCYDSPVSVPHSKSPQCDRSLELCVPD